MIRLKKAGFVLMALALSAAAFVPTSFALGIRLADQDAFATSRGDAFVATADNPSAVYYNPAGISQLYGQNILVGVYGITYGTHFSNATVSRNSKTEVAGIPQIYYTIKIPKAHLSFGLGIYSPFGLSESWPANAPFLASPNIPRSASMEYFTINPVVSYQPIRTLSFAAGPMFNFAQAELDSVPFGVPGNSLRFRGQDMTVGFNAGILWHPLPKHSFGVTYRSGSTMDFNGHADTRLLVPPYAPPSQAASAKFHLPQSVAFGYSFRPTPKWNLEFNADWTDWSSLKVVTLTTTPQQNIPFNWQASWFYELGVTRYLGKGWQLSAGYIYSENSVPDKNFNPIVPDSDRHIFSVGVGKRYKRLSWDLAYQLAWGPTRTVSAGSLTPANASAAGNYEFLSHALSIDLGYHF